jgi:transposase
MLGKKSGQIDIFNSMIFEKLVPKDHLLVKVDSLFDFSFVYEIVKENYSHIGRKSEDPVVLFKLNLLEYLYRLSDGAVLTRTQTDMAFRWFLGLNLDDDLPDDTTISHFRIHRLGEKGFEDIFNEVVKKCIENNLVGKKRYMIDSTNVDANVNYPSIRRLICNAFRKVVKQIHRFNSSLADELLKNFEGDIDFEYEKSDKVPVLKFCTIARKYVELIYLKTYDELQKNEKYLDAYSILWDIIEQYSNPKSKDKIISCVDPDARVAHKSPGVTKKGYKDHIIVDEDSEIILASTQTPFNVGDEKEFVSLIEKVEKNFNITPEEISADKVYGTNDNRGYLKDNEIISNIDFYDRSNVVYNIFDLRKFSVAEDLKSIKCPYGVTSTKFTISEKKSIITFTFDAKSCTSCPMREQCLYEKDLKRKNGRVIQISPRYDAVIRDMHRVSTEEFQVAKNKRYIIERRFATMVKNHGLRRSRYLGLKGARVHIILANTACNIIRMVNLTWDKLHPSFAII